MPVGDCFRLVCLTDFKSFNVILIKRKFVYFYYKNKLRIKLNNTFNKHTYYFLIITSKRWITMLKFSRNFELENHNENMSVRRDRHRKFRVLQRF